MIRCYKLIDKNGAEIDIKANSEKELYDKYYITEANKEKDVDISKINFSPVYENENIKMFNSIKEIIETKIIEYLKVSEIRMPSIIKNTEKLKELQELFGLKQFVCDGDYILPPASDFCVFSYFENKNFIKAEMPIKIYQFTNCYRIEDKDRQNNVLTRPTCFHLPDIHCFVENNVYQETLKHLKVYENILNELEIPYLMAMRITENEYIKQKEEIQNIAKKLKKNIIINIVPSSIRYWETKFKYIYKDSKGEYIQLSTVQVDYKSSKIFNIRMEGKNVIILHSSVRKYGKNIICVFG